MVNPFIAVVTHVGDVLYESDVFKPFSVNKDVSEKFGYLSDSVGDTISEKNKNYCELTVMYWLWKNLTNDYTHIGLCHYRRFLASDWTCSSRYIIKSKKELSRYFNESKLIDMLGGVDVVAPKFNVNKMTISQHYKCRHIPEDWIILMDVLREKYPNQFHRFENYFSKSNKHYWTNMFIMRSEIFNLYSRWLFDILFEVESRVKISSYPYQARVFGFMSERLFGLYINFFLDKTCLIKHRAEVFWDR